MPLIGLTGGIGAGKSTIAARLREHGAHVVDADVMAREAVAFGTPALNAIIRRFGSEVLLPTGELNRSALGVVVFADEAARKDLEDIVHPAVHALTNAAFERIRAADPDAAIVYDVPLLLEAKNSYAFDRIVVAHAPVAQRIQRLVVLRGMSEDEAQNRVESQATDEQRLAIADDVIDTSGSIQHTLDQVDALWLSLTSPRA
jgi:dephospho-CoA kinase